MANPAGSASPPGPEAEATRLHDGTRVQVLAGNPSHDELAALVVALDETNARPDAHRPPARPRWRRAARVEAVGGGPVASAGDLGPVGP